MNLYNEMIIAVLHCSESDAVEVEDIMRNDIFHSTLDWQTKAQLNKGAKKAWEIICFMRSTDGINYLKELKQLYNS